MGAHHDPRNCKVALLAGGKSGEREISLASGEGARAALEEAGYSITMLDPAERADLVRLMEEPFDVAFLCTHGRGGEDGVLQGFLETIGLPYTGSGVLGSALAMNKGKAKLVYRDAGVPTAASVTVKKSEPYELDAIIAQVGEHCVVKAINEGSTLGIYIVEGKEALQDAISSAFAFDDEVLIEQYIAGPEFTVPVVGNDDPEALPIIQIIPANDFYDFESKYAPGGSQHVCPAPLEEPIAEAMRSHAVAAHVALGCAGISRTDFILDADRKPWALETNTLPGMTQTSLVPDAARAAGIPFSQLCEMLIDYALEE